MREYQTHKVGAGTQLQAGIPKRPAAPAGLLRAQGLLLRGVVVVTYVTDSADNRYVALTGDASGAVAVYCDVLCYSSVPGNRTRVLQQVPVLQDRGGLHNGRIWKPRAATIDITGNPFDADRASNPAQWDGDHVVVGFLDDSLNLPIILGGIPHPSSDVGGTDKTVGHRLRLKVADGDPDFWKHHGTFYGVATNGDFTVDTSQANDGSVLTTGAEPAPPTDGKGAQRYKLPQDAERSTQLLDMADPAAPVVVATELLKKELYRLSFQGAGSFLEILIEGLNSLKVQGREGGAMLRLGDGAAHVVLGEAYQTWWDNTIKPLFDAFDAHVHSTGVGPSGPPTPTVSLPTYDTTITSTKMSLPNG